MEGFVGTAPQAASGPGRVRVAWEWVTPQELGTSQLPMNVNLVVQIQNAVSPARVASASVEYVSWQFGPLGPSETQEVWMCVASAAPEQIKKENGLCAFGSWPISSPAHKVSVREMTLILVEGGQK